MTPKILLVDDVDAVREGLALMLAPRFSVSTAANARQALETLRRDGPFAVVVSDQGMPEISGLQLLHAVHQEWPDAVGILLSGVPDVDVAVQAMQDGHVFRFLNKPCVHEVLAAAIEAALERHAQIRTAHLRSEELRFSKESLENFTSLLEERIERQTSVLSRLHRYAVDLNAATSMSEIVRLAAHTAHDLLGGRGIHVQVWDSENGGVGVDASAGPEMSAHMHREPLSTKEGRIGEIVVDLGAGDVTELPAPEYRLLASIASSTAVAAHNEFRRSERDEAQHATILALARLSERRDNETGKHLERVAAYCKLVAEGLRANGLHLSVISDEYIEDLVRSSPLHDIGKVGIPDSILLKPGKLSPEEWEIMKTHAEIGALTLASVTREYDKQGFLAMGRDIAWCHHEKWNGQGYPRGLKGPAIPLCARIVALADVYDALTTVRPYKPAWTHAQACEWLRANSGTHFDPDVVTAFVDRQDQFDQIRARSADSVEDVLEKCRELYVRPS